MISDARSTRSVTPPPRELSVSTTTTFVRTKSKRFAPSTNETSTPPVRQRSFLKNERKEHPWTAYTPSPRTTSKQRSSKRRTNNQGLQEHVTRDSMVDNLLLSFNDIPHGQGPYPKQPTYLSPFDEGLFVPKTKQQYRSSSPSSSISSLDDDKEDDVYKPRYPYNHSPASAPSRLNKSARRSKPNTPSRRSRGLDPNSSPIPAVWQARDYQPVQSGLEQELENTQDMGLTERWNSRRSRSNSLTLSTYLTDGHRGQSSSVTTATKTSTLAQDEGIHDTDGRTARLSMYPSTQTSAMTSSRPSISADAVPIDNFKQQLSSRDKVATITGSTDVLAENPYRRTQPPLARKHSDAPTGSESITTSTSGSGRLYSPTNHTPTKERPGFFRRMFSSSRSTHSSERQPSTPLPAAPVAQPGTVRRGTSKQYSSQMIYSPSRPATAQPKLINSETASTMSTTSAMPTLSAPPPPPPPIPDEEIQRPALKQRASFFLRRRKPAPEREPLPVVGDNSPKLPTDHAAISSATSLSSLRKAMDPLLVAAETTQAQIPDDASSFFGLGLLCSPTAPSRQRTMVNESSSTSSAPSFQLESAPASAEPQTEDLIQDEPGSGLEVPTSNEGVPSSTSSSTSSSSSSSASVSEYATLRPLEYPQSLVGARLSQPFASLEPATVLDQESPLSPLSPASEEPVPDVPERFTGTLDSHLEDRAPLTNRIWLKPSRESVHLHSLPSLPSLEMSQYSTPPTQHDSPASTDESTAAMETPVKPSNPRQVTSDTNARLTGAKSARSINASNTSIAAQSNSRDQYISVAELGKEGQEAEQRCKLFMESFDLTGLNILQALRHLCSCLALKGETSQLDRILTAFSQRWCECNSNNGFKSEDIVHTILYALLMLNTDLHSADNSQKMTRQQFIRNALHSIKSFSRDDFDRDATVRANRSGLRGGIPLTEENTSTPKPDANIDRPTFDQRQSDGQGSTRARPVSAVPSIAATASPFMFEARSFDNVALVNAPFDGPAKAWETQVEGVLKDFYGSLYHLRLPLFGGPDLPSTAISTSRPNLSATVSSSTMLRRSGSVMSKAVSERGSGRMVDFRTWSAKSRTMPKLPTIKNNSARSSIEDGSSVWSPSVSSTWSRGYGSASVSSDTLATHVTSADRLSHHAPGFANAIQHAAAKDTMDDSNEEQKSPENFPMLEDESLALAGAPWSKEGIVHHKMLTATDKKSKNSKWEDCFAVVEKGNLSTFSFTNDASMRNQKNKNLRSGPVGGGNWTESAQALCVFPLGHSIAHVMPPPGYDKARPYVFALTLSNGNRHLFQVGTPDIAKEFVSTTMYWAARMSKEPLGGGVSNVEYGWSDAILATARDDSGQKGKSSRSSAHIAHSFEQQSRTGRVFAGDRATIIDWTPPAQSNAHSTLPEHEQLQMLRIYINDVEHEFRTHNEMRTAMESAYSGRTVNLTKALQNWEKKSSYLLTKVQLFRTYVEVLERAGVRRREVDREREAYEEDVRRVRQRDNRENAMVAHGGSAGGVGLGVMTG